MRCYARPLSFRESIELKQRDLLVVLWRNFSLATFTRLLTVDLFSFFGEQQIGLAHAPSVAHSEADRWGSAEDVAELALISSGKDSDRTNVATEGAQLPLPSR